MTDSTGSPARVSRDLLHSEITDVILGSFYDVYNQLGSGFLESVYEGALEIDLQTDLLVDGRVIVELKAVRAIMPVHEAQLINLLKATDLEVGLILNFGPKPEFKRLVYSSLNKPFHTERV